MTDNEIIKALECCLLSNEQQEERCAECPMCETPLTVCQHLLSYHALDLINRQKAEIDELQRRNSELEIELKAMRGAANSYKAEIERLEAMIDAAEEHFAPLPFKNKFDEYIGKAKAEAIEDVLLTLEAEAVSSDKYISEYDDSEVQKAANQALWKAYSLVKEMVGEDK